MTVDPVDGCTFWYTNMYFPVQGANWVTRIGSFKFPTCASPTTTSLVSQPNPSVFGQTVTLTATVGVSDTGVGTPSGVVIFNIGAGLPVTASLTNGVATLITSTLPVGTYPITATYGGDSIFSGSQALLVTGQTVDKASTTTALASLVASSLRQPGPDHYGYGHCPGAWRRDAHRSDHLHARWRHGREPRLYPQRVLSR